MSAIISFSDGGEWFIGQRGWNAIMERAFLKLKQRGLADLTDEIQDYGVAFDLLSSSARIPVARALYDAELELQVELGSADGWDIDNHGPYFGELTTRLERELAT